MGTVTVSGISFQGTFGTPIPINCPDCGLSVASLPFGGMKEMSLRDVSVECQKCGRPVKIERAHYTFTYKALEVLASRPVSKKQLRRYARTVTTTKDLDAIRVNSSTIGPEFRRVTELALQEPNPTHAFKKLVAVVGAILTIGGGVITGDEIWDRYNKGELFEQHHLQDAGSVHEEADPDAEDIEDQKPNRRGPSLPDIVDI